MKIIRHARLLSLLNRIHTSCHDAIELRRLDALLRGRSLRGSQLRAELATQLQGDYLISSEKGIFRARGRTVENVFSFSAFGLSIAGDQLFVAVPIGEWSHIVAARLDLAADGSLRLSSFRLLRTIETKYHNERVHQIHARGKSLAVACTRTNSILLLDTETGEQILDIYPLCDATGFPIHTDHNHLNSVYHAGDVIFFVAHNAGNVGSFVGFVGPDRTIAAAYPHRGAHDIVPTRRGLLYSDTFGAPIKDYRGGGNLLIGRSTVLPLNHERGFVVRGFAGTGNEMLVGHSHLARRLDRFKASGSLLVLKGGELKSVNPMPFSQAYDIIRIDGRKFDDDIASVDAATARAFLARDVGDIVYDAPFYVQRTATREYERGGLQATVGAREEMLA